jgi:hypothetical protein
MADPVGVPGPFCSLVEFATRLSEKVAPDFADQLMASLLSGDDTTED